MNNRFLLCGREWNVAGNWFAPLKKLESFKSVLLVEYYNQSSSAGDWDGFFVQKLGGKYFLIMFAQENNYPNEGFTLRTGSILMAEGNYQPSLEECYKIYEGTF